jgi:ABC-2 type transport system ATP-binding protein
MTLVMGQRNQLVWDIPVADSFELNRAIYRIPEAEYRQTREELSELLDLEPLLTKPVRNLSLGERMKCELAGALLHRPRVLFLDEPTLGLDVTAQRRIRGFIAEYADRYDATVLLTSHYMADIVALCPRVLLIHEGRLIYDGSLSGLVERFAPYREVRLDLAEPLSLDVLRRYGEVETLEGLRAVLIVERSRLTETVARVLAELKPRDLGISDPPVERVVGRLFLEGTSERPSAAEP